MNPAERRQAIASVIDDQGVCAYDELATRLQVSAMTIRRDVDVMARAGQVIKALGGVQKAAQADLYETDLLLRINDHKAEKRGIAQHALTELGSRRTVFLDGGTTCLELAKLIAAEKSGLTVVTNSALGCIEMGKSRSNMTVGIGGQYDASSASFVGPSAEEGAARFFVDLAFVSTKGLIADRGTFESAIATYQIKQIIARQATRVVLLVDHSKFGQRALSKVLDISQIHMVVTDDQAPAEDLEILRRRGCEVVAVPVARRSARPVEDGSARRNRASHAV
jgi:DeoR family transcriptional regulator of aga operon